MEKIDINDVNIKKQIHDGCKSIVYELFNGDILKIFSPFILDLYRINNIPIEEKILASKPIPDVSEIIVPHTAVYIGNTFCGYISKKAEGIDYNEYDKTLTQEDNCDLKRYADEYTKLESIVRRGNEAGIVFPDLCTFDNIFIDKNKNFSMIDYDGLQVGNYITPIMSTSLGNQEQYFCPKYCVNKLFTPELDKKSLITLYFLNTFHVNLSKVGLINPFSGDKVTLDFIFDLINLDDYDIQNKVWKCFQLNKENEFLGDDVYSVFENYKMEAIHFRDATYVKKLVRK